MTTTKVVMANPVAPPDSVVTWAVQRGQCDGAVGRGRMVQAERERSGHRRGLVVMGVSGSGKSTLAACLAERLGCPFLEGDSFHSATSVTKMRSGHPLEDGDRWPWLDRLGAAIGDAASGAGHGGIAVAACSALKRVYRERLSAASAVPLAFVLLETMPAEIARRLATREGHYMPASLLDSQLATLERPGPDEHALTLDAGRTPDALAADVVAWLGIAPPA
ncbi:gluconokinase [Sphingomonas sp. Leaf34]|uniref:gluconokinase n=2 Tax=unclassified Sphingomonas TaxID=196159 RepID=UPI003FA79E08